MKKSVFTGGYVKRTENLLNVLNFLYNLLKIHFGKMSTELFSSQRYQKYLIFSVEDYFLLGVINIIIWRRKSIPCTIQIDYNDPIIRMNYIKSTWFFASPRERKTSWKAIGFRAFNKCPSAGARMKDIIYWNIWSSTRKNDSCVPNSHNLQSHFTQCFHKDSIANHAAFSTHNLLFHPVNLPLILNDHVFPRKHKDNIIGNSKFHLKFTLFSHTKHLQ